MLTELRQFAERYLASRNLQLVSWEPAPSPEGRNPVWKLKATDGLELFLKAHRQPRKFNQELAAYREWLPNLPAGSATTPMLLASQDNEPLALLLSAVAGLGVADLLLDASQLANVYHQAGRFLRELHGLPHKDADRVSLAEAMHLRLAQTLDRARELVDPQIVQAVRACAEPTIPLLGDFTRVPCHRDFQQCNWLLSEAGAVGVIDFEHSRADCPLYDFHKLWDGLEPSQVPLAASAFWGGYGRELDDRERRIMQGSAACMALGTVVWAREHADRGLELQGHAALARNLGGANRTYL